MDKAHSGTWSYRGTAGKNLCKQSRGRTTMPNPFGASGGQKNSTSKQSGGGGAGRRKTIIVKGTYGTQTVSTEKSCKHCNTRAVGVLVLEPFKNEEDKGKKKVVPMCGKHRDRFKDKSGIEWETADFRRFVDQ